MKARTVKGPIFTIVVDEKRIIVKHVFCKGKRCRIILPPGVFIEEQREKSESRDVDKE